MSINTTKASTKHQKSIIKQEQNSNNLSFKEILPIEMLEKHTNHIPCRNHVFTHKLTIHTFLSQVISADQSCQSAVVNLVAKLIVQDQDISANTAAYCKARARLPNEKKIILLNGQNLKNQSGWMKQQQGMIKYHKSLALNLLYKLFTHFN